MARNARAFTAIATVAAGVLFGLAVWRAARPEATVPRVPGALIAGRVVAEDGHGIAGLRVVIADRSGVTGEGGAFAVAGLAPGRHGVLVAGPDVLPAVVEGVVAPAADVRLEVARAEALAGRVSEGGAPASGAEVVVSTGSGAARSATVDGSGAFRIEGLGEGRYAVIARRGASAALLDGVERVGAGPFEDVELVLAPAAALAGRVVDEAGAPVVGAHLVFVAAAAGAAQRRVTSGEGGAFTLEGLPPGDWSVDVQAPGYLALTKRGIALQAGASSALALTLARGAVVTGRVTDRAGAAIAGAVVDVAGADGRVLVSAVERARRSAWAAGAAAGTAPAGGRLLPVGDLGVMVGPIPYPSPSGAHPSGPAAPAEDDPSLAGFSTAADGSFRIDAVPPGKIVVRASAAGWARGESAPLDVQPGAPATVAVMLARGATVVVHVVDAAGADVRAALVRLGAGIAVTDADGRARFEHVVGAAVAVVDGPDRGHVEHELAAPAELALVEETVALAAARPARAEAAGGGGTVRMDLRDELTRGPILAFTAVARGPDGATVKKTGARGELTLGPLAPGSWTVRIEARGFATTDAAFDIAAGAETPLRVELSQGGVVGGTVYGEHGDPVGGAVVECGPVRGTTSATGAFRLAGTPTGDVVVRASHPEAGSGQIVVPLHPGDEALTLEIRLGR